MIDVLYFSDREVKQKLFARVAAAQRPVLVTQVRQDRHSRAPEAREPFASLEQELGDLVDQLLVADEGTTDGMWRDPVGELADQAYPDDREAAYRAASGYMLFSKSRVIGVVKKHGQAADDRWFLQELLAQKVPGVPPPDPARRPGHKQRRDPFAEPRRPHTQGRPEAPPEAPRNEVDPWKVLGISPGTPLPEAKKAFRALIAQYHPDKVEHLAPEFRELAERKTREILEAWQQLEARG